MSTQLEFSSPLAPPLPLRRFSVAQYHQLGEFGVLTPEDKVELLEGWIVEKMNQRPIHGFIVRFLSEWFQSRLPSGLIVQCQLPITAQRSEPATNIGDEPRAEDALLNLRGETDTTKLEPEVFEATKI